MKDINAELQQSPCGRCWIVHELQDRGPSFTISDGEPVLVVSAIACDCACHLNPVRKIRRGR